MIEHEHAGHRKRLLAKLESGVLEDHEYLEALLFNAIPRRNTNDIAHRLLSRFGSIKGIFDASVRELQSVNGIGENAAQYLYLIGTIFKRLDQTEEKSRFPRFYKESDFVAFLRDYYKDAKKEYLDCFVIDERGRIRQTKRFTSSDENAVNISTGEFGSFLSESRPFAVIISHNHLSGDSSPSDEDNNATYKIQMMCHIQNVRFCDHYIISPVDTFSYYTNGNLRSIAKFYSLNELLKRVQQDEERRGLKKLF